MWCHCGTRLKLQDHSAVEFLSHDVEGLLNGLQLLLRLAPLPAIGGQRQQEHPVLVCCGLHQAVGPQLPARAIKQRGCLAPDVHA